MRYRILLISLVAAIGVYAIYWLVLSAHLKSTIAEWVQARKLEGIEVTYDKLSVTGFPYRFEVELVKPLVIRAGGDAPFRFTTPRLVMESLAWKPNHVVVLTQEVTLDVAKSPLGSINLVVKGGRASLVSALNGNLKRAAAVSDSMSIKLGSKPGKISTVGHTEVHIRTEYDYPARKEGDLDPAAPPLDNLALSFADINLGGMLANPYGDRIATLLTQIELRGITPPARRARQMADWRDRGGSLELLRFDIKWGIYDAKASGTLALDKEMRPLGAFVAKVKGYEPLIDYLHAINFIDLELANNIKATLNVVVQSGTARDEGRVSVPIVLQDGRFFFGPLPLAKLPSIAPLLKSEAAIAAEEKAAAEAAKK